MMKKIILLACALIVMMISGCGQGFVDTMNSSELYSDSRTEDSVTDVSGGDSTESVVFTDPPDGYTYLPCDDISSDVSSGDWVDIPVVSSLLELKDKIENNRLTDVERRILFGGQEDKGYILSVHPDKIVQPVLAGSAELSKIYWKGASYCCYYGHFLKVDFVQQKNYDLRLTRYTEELKDVIQYSAVISEFPTQVLLYDEWGRTKVRFFYSVKDDSRTVNVIEQYSGDPYTGVPKDASLSTLIDLKNSKTPEQYFIFIEYDDGINMIVENTSPTNREAYYSGSWYLKFDIAPLDPAEES